MACVECAANHIAACGSAPNGRRAHRLLLQSCSGSYSSKCTADLNQAEQLGQQQRGRPPPWRGSHEIPRPPSSQDPGLRWSACCLHDSGKTKPLKLTNVEAAKA
eukprot:6173184-Pleurochrysis_carterae.AAC.7